MLPLWLSLARKHKEWENVFCCEGCKQSFLLNQISNCDIGDIKLPEGVKCNLDPRVPVVGMIKAK